MAQSREVKLEINPTAPKAEPVKIEQINNRDILRVASQADTIRIPLTDDTWTQIENLMQSNVGTGLTLKDIEGADVTIMKVSANMKPDASSGQKRRNQLKETTSDCTDGRNAMQFDTMNIRHMKILVTGSAGFIGSNLVLRLLESKESIGIVGLDNLNNYYDPSLKEYRLRIIEQKAKNHPEHTYKFIKGDIADKSLIDKLFAEEKFDIVVNLAAQAGVRYSIENPDAYIQSNMIGFYNILEACRHNPVQHLVYASSSSVYGGNKKVPFSTDDRVDNPVSLYAATKKSNELFAHCYSKLYDIPTTGLRFFTVYGPAGRPDMAYFGFTNKLLKGQTIQIYNFGNCRRDFTYVDDIVEGIVRVMYKAPARQKGEDGLPIPPYAVYNIGGGQPENLLDFVQILQEELLRAGVLPADYDFDAHKQLVPMQPGDVPTTYADASALERDFGFTPKITLREGLRKFAEWYKEYYG